MRTRLLNDFLHVQRLVVVEEQNLAEVAQRVQFGKSSLDDLERAYSMALAHRSLAEAVLGHALGELKVWRRPSGPHAAPGDPDAEPRELMPRLARPSYGPR